jgi:cytoskeletal protein CcmA (bactofilin family)
MIPMPNIRRSLFTLLILVGISLAAVPVLGSVFQKGETVVISNVHVIDDDMYVRATTLRMEGTINGDLLAFAYDAKIQGQVSKSVNVFARTITHTGRCDGSLRSFSEDLSIDGTVGGSVTALGRLISLNKGAVVERDMWASGQDVLVSGIVKGKLTARGGEITITGQIGGDVDIDCDRLFIKPPAIITGNLTYLTKDPVEIDSSGVTITGTVKRGTPQAKDENADASTISSIATKIAGLCAAFLFGMIIMRLFRPYAEASYRQLTSRFATSLAAGLLVLGILIGCIIILAMTLLTGLASQFLMTSGPGAAFGVILLVFSILMLPIASFSVLSGAILFYTGRIIIGLLLGALIMRKTSKDKPLPGFGALFVGLLLLSLVFAIPIFGAICYVAVAALGAGAIALGIKECWREVRSSRAEAANTVGQ